MTQFGVGPELAAQCPIPPTPDGWRPWADADGPIPDTLLKRSKSLAEDQSVPLGTTESYPLPGVTTLIRVEPQAWGRNDSGGLVQGCFRVGGIYLPSQTVSAETLTAPESTTNKVITALTIASLGVGTIATVASLRKKKK